eukprot:1158128-Pelagomonas_calceolata.AAC.5
MEDQGDAMDDGVEEAEAAGLGPGSYSNKEREEAERRASSIHVCTNGQARPHMRMSAQGHDCKQKA